MTGDDPYRILVVDDDEPARRAVVRTLVSAGFAAVEDFGAGEAALRRADERPFDFAVLDLQMPGMSGEALWAELHERHPGTQAVALTGVNDVDTAVRLLRAGLRDYLLKPVDPARLVHAARQAAELSAARREAAALRRVFQGGAFERPEAFTELVIASPEMESVCRYAEAICRTSHPILITGGTGVGKELIARAIHRASGRAGAFVALNVASLDGPLLSAALFGHRRGAFTDAREERPGLVDAARGGTLFLDEIGDLPLDAQTKLLRFLQEREYYPVGSDAPRRSDAGILAATHRTDGELADPARFRRDLLYRLTTHRVHVPSLDRRRGEIPVLFRHFVAEACAERGIPVPELPAELFARLSERDYPGNVRQLRALACDAVYRHAAGEPFPAAGGSAGAAADDEEAASPAAPIRFGERLPTLAEASRELVSEALRRAGGNGAEAARLLGITRQALHRRRRGIPEE